MADITGSSREPIGAHALNVTRGTGVAAITTTLGAVLTASYGTFNDAPIPIVIALIAAITVGLVVAGFVIVTDMRVRSQQAIAASYLSYLRKQGETTAVSHGNGHDPQQFVEKAAGISPSG